MSDENPIPVTLVADFEDDTDIGPQQEIEFPISDEELEKLHKVVEESDEFEKSDPLGVILHDLANGMNPLGG